MRGASPTTAHLAASFCSPHGVGPWLPRQAPGATRERPGARPGFGWPWERSFLNPAQKLGPVRPYEVITGHGVPVPRTDLAGQCRRVVVVRLHEPDPAGLRDVVCSVVGSVESGRARAAGRDGIGAEPLHTAVREADAVATPVRDVCDRALVRDHVTDLAAAERPARRIARVGEADFVDFRVVRVVRHFVLLLVIGLDLAGAADPPPRPSA